MSLTLATPTTQITEDETFTIHGLSWDQYVAINDALGDQAGLRTLYLDGSLTFVRPALVHESSADVFDKIILALAVGCRVPLRPVGSTTLRQPGQVGVEGDRAYYLGANADRMRGVASIDLTVHPAPDLAIEVENSHKATEAMAIYAQLGLPEVWRHDARRGTLGFWHLQEEGTYAPLATSVAFPFLTTADVLQQVQRADELPSYIDWFGQLTDWVRDVILPRLSDQP